MGLRTSGRRAGEAEQQKRQPLPCSRGGSYSKAHSAGVVNNGNGECACNADGKV